MISQLLLAERFTSHRQQSMKYEENLLGLICLHCFKCKTLTNMLRHKDTGPGMISGICWLEEKKNQTVRPNVSKSELLQRVMCCWNFNEQRQLITLSSCGAT